MADAGRAQQLRIRVTESVEPRETRIEAIDSQGKVVGDLSYSTLSDGVQWQSQAGGLSVLTLKLAVERASVDSIEVEGVNITRRRAHG